MRQMHSDFVQAVAAFKPVHCIKLLISEFDYVPVCDACFTTLHRREAATPIAGIAAKKSLITAQACCTRHNCRR